MMKKELFQKICKIKIKYNYDSAKKDEKCIFFFIKLEKSH